MKFRRTIFTHLTKHFNWNLWPWMNAFDTYPELDGNSPKIECVIAYWLKVSLRWWHKFKWTFDTNTGIYDTIDHAWQTDSNNSLHESNKYSYWIYVLSNCDRLLRLKASIAIILRSTFEHFIRRTNTIMKIYKARLGFGKLIRSF